MGKPQPFKVFDIECRRAEQNREMPEEIHPTILTFLLLHRRHSPANGSLEIPNAKCLAVYTSMYQYKNRMTAALDGTFHAPRDASAGDEKQAGPLRQRRRFKMTMQ